MNCSGTRGRNLDMTQQKLQYVIKEVVSKYSLRCRVGYQTYLDFSEAVKKNTGKKETKRWNGFYFNEGQ
jgi:hypothetical protein